jgi:hypothetical protein
VALSASPAFAQATTDNAQARSHPGPQPAGPNATASYTISFHNTGTSTWSGPAYVLKRENDGASFPLGTRDAQGGCDPLPPQGNCAWQFSPSRGAATADTWHYRMFHNGTPFGETIDVQFVAAGPAPATSPGTGGGAAAGGQTSPPAAGQPAAANADTPAGPVVAGTGNTTAAGGTAPAAAGAGGAPGAGGAGGGAAGGGGGGGRGGGGRAGGGGGGGGGGAAGGAAGGGPGAPQASTSADEIADCAVPLPPGARLVGTATRSTLAVPGGQVLAPDLGTTLAVPADALPQGPLSVTISGVGTESLPPPPSPSFQFGDRAFEVSLMGPPSPLATDLAPDQGRCRGPLPLTYQPTPNEQALAGGDPDRLRPALWTGSGWLPLDCSVDPTSGALSCGAAYVGLVAVLIAPPRADPLDFDVAGGHFYQQTNGFNGAGELGFAVVDDADAPFWSEFQRLGGVDRLGYPISGRFQHSGFLTQVFQKAALQWRPDLGQAEPLNTLDDLAQAGADAWLDHASQVPPAPTTSDDTGLGWDQLVARRVGLLDAYPALRTFFQADPDPLSTFGLPVAVKDYGNLVSVRLERTTLQLWNVDVPWASAGTVVVASAGDLAKQAGLWPAAAVTPAVSVAPPGPPTASPDAPSP